MKVLYFLLLTLLIGFATANAQVLVPATSEDLEEFDRQAAQSMKGQQNKKAKSNFGQLVSEEAKQLMGSESDQRREFGKWVSSQKKKADQGLPSAAGNASHPGSDSSAQRRAGGKDKKHK